MNERIRELAEQAGVYEGVFTKHDGVPCDLKGYGMLPDEMAKFAELIVRECAEVGLDSVENGDDLDAIMKRVHNNILTHFGVEE